MGKIGHGYGREWHLLRFLLAGLMAGVAMIPFGIFYKYGLSLPVNVYGELIVVAVFGELMGAGLELYLAKPLGSSRLRDRARGTFAQKQRSRRYSPGRYAVHPADDLNHRTN